MGGLGKENCFANALTAVSSVKHLKVIEYCLNLSLEMACFGGSSFLLYPQ